MANRPVFKTRLQAPFFDEIDTSFTYYSGFSDIQKQRSIESLHNAFNSKYPNVKLMEISRYSVQSIGKKLSAFNLETGFEGKPVVECVFQAGKVFECGGPFTDLLSSSPAQAKKDSRITSSGNLIGFEVYGDRFPIVPRTFFYDWIYINALSEHPELIDEIVLYDAFTDIAFNPHKSINCQARSVAIFVSLYKSGIISEVLKSKEIFKDVVYSSDDNIQQLSILG